MDRLIFENGSYRTPAARPSLFARALPSARFYTRMAAVVLRASRTAQRGAFDAAAWSASSLETIRALEEVGAAVEIDGMEHLCALATPCVVIGNHMSSFETLALPTIIMTCQPVSFVIKESLVEHPAMKHIMRARDLIVVGRENPREDLKAVLEGGERRIRDGLSIVVFPQTTRTALFDPGAFSSIGVKLARRANVPVVPLALKTDAWDNGRLMKDIGRIDPSRTVHFEFGAPIPVEGRGTEEQARVVEFIASRLRAWGGTTVAG
jgi:1-acyl-sn-glycerol-3-phosphate acyltransferase